MIQKPGKMPRSMFVYVLAIVFSSLALGLSDSVYANYFRDAYQVDAFRRGLIEAPRELPGVLCVFITSSLSFFGENRLIIVAQALMFIGIIVLGLATPVFAVMLIFLFINSLGMHVAMPLQDSIGMSLAEPGSVGRRMGMYNACKTGASMLMGILVFIGFRAGFFSFTTKIKTIFLIAAGLFLLSFTCYFILNRMTGNKRGAHRSAKLVFKRQYRYFYCLAITRGVQKQITFVFAPWIMIDLMSRGADTMAILAVVASLIGIFVLPMVGKWIDRLGVARLLLVESVGFISIYLAYAIISAGVVSGVFATTGVALFLVFFLFIMEKTINGFGMVRTVYVRSIVPDASEVTSVLSTGLSIDHVISISFAYLGGVIWTSFGPMYLFLFAALMSVANLAVSMLVRKELKEKAA